MKVFYPDASSARLIGSLYSEGKDRAHSSGIIRRLFTGRIPEIGTVATRSRLMSRLTVAGGIVLAQSAAFCKRLNSFPVRVSRFGKDASEQGDIVISSAVFRWIPA